LTPLLEVKGLVSGYGKLAIVQDVSFQINEREITSLIGPNGSGKSTLLKSIFGLVDIHSGSIFFNGSEITKETPEKVALKGIAYVPQRDNVFPNLTVHENLEIGGVALRNRDLTRKEISKVYDFLPVLREMTKSKARTLSGGQRQMLALGRALMLSPRLLLLDEPTAALAPQVVSEVLSKIKQVRESGVAILIVEQNAREALNISDKGIVLASGKTVFQGPPSQISQNEQIIKLFLGV
jgi:branched-chain amino acid transport system ATP-binding protein